MEERLQKILSQGRRLIPPCGGKDDRRGPDQRQPDRGDRTGNEGGSRKGRNPCGRQAHLLETERIYLLLHKPQGVCDDPERSAGEARS